MLVAARMQTMFFKTCVAYFLTPSIYYGYRGIDPAFFFFFFFFFPQSIHRNHASFLGRTTREKKMHKHMYIPPRNLSYQENIQNIDRTWKRTWNQILRHATKSRQQRRSTTITWIAPKPHQPLTKSNQISTTYHHHIRNFHLSPSPSRSLICDSMVKPRGANLEFLVTKRRWASTKPDPASDLVKWILRTEVGVGSQRWSRSRCEVFWYGRFLIFLLFWKFGSWEVIGMAIWKATSWLSSIDRCVFDFMVWGISRNPCSFDWTAACQREYLDFGGSSIEEKMLHFWVILDWLIDLKEKGNINNYLLLITHMILFPFPRESK